MFQLVKSILILTKGADPDAISSGSMGSFLTPDKKVLTVLPAVSDNDVMFCLQSYHGFRTDRSLIRSIGLIHK